MRHLNPVEAALAIDAGKRNHRILLIGPYTEDRLNIIHSLGRPAIVETHGSETLSAMNVFALVSLIQQQRPGTVIVPSADPDILDTVWQARHTVYEQGPTPHLLMMHVLTDGTTEFTHLSPREFAPDRLYFEERP